MPNEKEIKISDELQALVDKKNLSIEEAQLIQSVRNGEIENPIKKKKDVDSDLESEQGLTALIKDINNNIETADNLIDKTDKAITMIQHPETTLFEDTQYFDDEEKKKLNKVLNEPLKVILENVKGVLSEQVDKLKVNRREIQNIYSNTQMLIEDSQNVNIARVNKMNKENEEPKESKTVTEEQKL